MEVTVHTPEAPLPVDRAYVVSIVIKSFKGRREVEVHLFRAGWEQDELGGIDWEQALETAPGGTEPEEIEKSRRFLMEAFTLPERDELIEYLKTRYADRLSAITALPLGFPLPAGITPLGEVPLGADVGIIRFEQIPHYALPFPVHGLFDLGRHKPMVEMTEHE